MYVLMCMCVPSFKYACVFCALICTYVSIALEPVYLSICLCVCSFMCLIIYVFMLVCARICTWRAMSACVYRSYMLYA